MSDFYRRFLMEDVPRATAGTNKQIFLGAFGKHPGWDDHVEDLGLETASLVQAKSLFYVQGIGGEIDAGAWEKLDDSQRLPAFKHVFVWQRPGQYLVGRLWASSDGKGRTRYPMVVCAHCAGVSLFWALDQVLPRLEQIEQACVTTQSAEEVRAILGRHRTDLRSAASGQTTELSPPNLDTSFITRFAARPELGPQQEGWLRILYSVQSQFGAFARGKFNPKAAPSLLRPQQIRVPRAADSISKSIVQWSSFFLSQVDPQTPILLTVPLEEQWVDVTVGEPASQEMFCLRATPKAVPLASEVPYNLSPEFVQRGRQLLGALEAGRPPASILSNSNDGPAPVPAPDAGAPRNKFLKWFGGSAALVAVAAAITVAILPKNPEGSAVIGDSAVETPSGEFVVTARQTSASPPPAVMAALPPATSTANEVAGAEKKAAEEKRAADEMIRIEAEAQRKAIAEEQARLRLADEAAARREAEERQFKEKAAAEKAARELAMLKTDMVKPAVTQNAPTTSPPVSTAVARTNSIGMVLVQMPSGYWVGRHEVTQAQFEKVTGRNASSVKDPVRPVENVNWDEAMDFCRRLTSREEAAAVLPKGFVYTLPTEAQWTEFTADADWNTAVTSLQRKRNSSEPVGSTPANRLGLHDVRGNVWEWCLTSDNSRKPHGGGFNSIKGFAAKIPDVWPLSPEQRRSEVGFRCVLVKQP